MVGSKHVIHLKSTSNVIQRTTRAIQSTTRTIQSTTSIKRVPEKTCHKRQVLYLQYSKFRYHGIKSSSLLRLYVFISQPRQVHQSNGMFSCNFPLSSKPWRCKQLCYVTNHVRCAISIYWCVKFVIKFLYWSNVVGEYSCFLSFHALLSLFSSEYPLPCTTCMYARTYC